MFELVAETALIGGACNYFDADSELDRARETFAYTIFAHEHLSDDRDLLISYVLNPPIQGAVLDHPDRYVPRFLKIPWAEFVDPEIGARCGIEGEGQIGEGGVCIVEEPPAALVVGGGGPFWDTWW